MSLFFPEMIVQPLRQETLLLRSKRGNSLLEPLQATLDRLALAEVLSEVPGVV
jgi:hypothetical protein